MKAFGIEAVRDFEGDLEAAIGDLEAAIADIVGVAEDVENEIFNADGSAGVDMTELCGLLDRLVEVPEEATAVFRDFNWKVARALRALKRATVHETAEGERP